MIGHTVSHYRILQRIGGGGMGLVYRAEDLKLRRHVALKFLAPELTRDEDAKKRFLHEAQAASALDHPNICSIYEIDETPEGQVFIAMACYEGESVRARIARGPLEPHEAFVIAYSVARGLARAHATGIIHRDIKPANVMITADGLVKIIDFGLSKLAGRSRVTGSGATLGTVAYMSPEQARSEESDARSDIWSLGAMLFEMLAGRLPFRGDIDQAMVYSILNESPVPLREARPGLPEKVAHVVMKCLEKNPDDRYQTAVEFCDAVAELSRDMGWDESFSGSTIFVPPRRPRRRARRWVLAGAGLAMVVAAVLGWKYWREESIYTTDVRLAVLPFERIGDTPSQAYVDGLSEWVGTAFRRAGYRRESTWTVPFTVVFAARPTGAVSARDTYGVNLVVTGNVQRFGEGHRLTMRLVDARRNRERRVAHVSLSGNQDVVAMQDSLGMAVLDLLGVTPSREEAEAVVGQRTASRQAFDLYLEGCGTLLRPRADPASRQAIELLRAATAGDSLYAAAWVKLAEAEMGAARRVKPYGDLAPAWNAVNTALHCDSSRADAHHLASILHNYEDRPASAARSLRRAQAHEPRNVGLLEALAFISLRQKRFDEAVRYYRDALRIAPDYTAIHAGLGWLYGRLGQRDEELASTLQAARLAPANLYALNRLGACYYERDELALARRYWEKAFVIQPDCANTSNLGLVTYLDGRFADAVGYFQYAIEHCDSLSADSWANLAAALYWTRDRREEGVRMYRRAIVRAEARLQEKPDDGLAMARLADYHAMAGDTARALEFIERASAYTGDAISAEISYAYARLGHDDLALRFAGDAVRRGFPLSAIRREPLFRDLVKDGRFTQMVELSKQEENGH